jgi:hypothetical protein
VKMTWQLVSVRAAAVAAAIVVTGVATAGMVLTSPSPVVRVEAYTDFGDGDVIFQVSGTVSGCTGFWLSPADPGYKIAYATLVMAKAAQINVRVYAYDNLLWPGGAPASYCKVRSITAE